MCQFSETEKMIDCCAACGEEFTPNAGHYIFDDNAFCPTCWDKGQITWRRRMLGRMNENTVDTQ